MPAGLQCWDANGKLIVDIGDYNCRFIGSTTIFIGNNQVSVSKSFPGLTLNGSFGVVASSVPDFDSGSFAVRTYNNGFTVYCTAVNTSASTLTVDLYGFI